MGRFDTKPVQIFIDVPGYDVERAAKTYREMSARRTLRAKQKSNPTKPAQGPMSNPPSQTTTEVPTVLGPDSTDKVASDGVEADPNFHMEL